MQHSLLLCPKSIFSLENTYSCTGPPDISVSVAFEFCTILLWCFSCCIAVDVPAFNLTMQVVWMFALSHANDANGFSVFPDISFL